jgi:2-C-methyl-D-erythritol 4-phosphate cytidylyltransferase
MGIVALIPAAGRGERMGFEKPKGFLSLGGVPLLAHALEKFQTCPGVDEVLPLVPEGKIDFCSEIVRNSGLTKVSQILAGGPERQDSVYLGLQALKGRADWVIIHDGARPFVPPALIAQTIGEAQRWKAVVTALRAGDTLKEVSEDARVLKTVDRSCLWMIQTPQAFEYHLIFEAHKKAEKDGFRGTDDASLVEKLGFPVKVIEGSRFNFKITTPEDLVLGNALLEYWGRSHP